MALAVILCFALLNGRAFGANAPVEDPETKVEISIYDLVKPHKRTAAEIKSGLDARYVENVIQILKQNRTALLSCVKNDEQVGATFKLLISADGQGKVAPPAGADAIVECAAQELSHLSYPKHRIEGLVVIEFPLILEKRAL